MKSIEPYQGIANIYDEIRPSYPMELIEDIVSLTGINHRSHLLEVGAGTGKATLIFAEKKFKVIAIEPCEDMAKVLFMSSEKWSTMQLKMGPLSDVRFGITKTSFF